MASEPLPRSEPACGQRGPVGDGQNGAFGREARVAKAGRLDRSTWFPTAATLCRVQSRRGNQSVSWKPSTSGLEAVQRRMYRVPQKLGPGFDRCHRLKENAQFFM